MNLLRFSVCTFAFVLAPAAAWSVDLTPSKDNTIFQNSSNLSGGGEIGIFVGANNLTTNPARRGLVQFDVAGDLPAGVAIVDASLTLTLEMANNTNSHQILVYRLTTEWGEGTAGAGMLSGAGFTAADGDATWTEAKHNQVNWTAGGAISTPANASTLVSGNTVNSTFTWSSAALLNTVKDWYANPSTNFGWSLVNFDENIQQSVKVFYSKEFTTNSSRWPKLTITYVPEPTTLVLGLLASPLLVLHRARKS